MEAESLRRFWRKSEDWMRRAVIPSFLMLSPPLVDDAVIVVEEKSCFLPRAVLAVSARSVG